MSDKWTCRRGWRWRRAAGLGVCLLGNLWAISGLAPSAVAQTRAPVNPVRPAGYVPAHERAMGATAGMRVVGAQNPIRQAALTGPGDAVESVLAEPIPAPAQAIPDPHGAGDDWVFDESPYGSGEFLEGQPLGDDCGCGGGGEGPCLSDDCATCGGHPYHDHWRAKHDVLFALFKHFQFFSGAHAFKNPGNRGAESSFGFHQGLNFSANLPYCRSLSFQIGAQVTESNLNGSVFTDDDRIQFFTTAGVFRRVDAGLQGGVVFDYMHDDWDYEVDLTQLRAELSWKYPHMHELGFFGAISTREKFLADPALGAASLDTTDLYAFFYRCRWQGLPGSECRFFGGFSGDSDGVVGSDFLLPVCNNLALQLDYTYLIPADELRASIDESWNLSFNIVWYPGCGFTAPNNYCRPLFNVANNGVMMLNDQQ